LLRRDTIQKPIRGRNVSGTRSNIRLPAINHFQQQGAKNFPPHLRAADLCVDGEIDLELQAEPRLAEIHRQPRQLRQIRLRILRVNDYRGDPRIALVQQLEQVALRAFGKVTNRSANSDLCSVNNELP
jgi:hypothetical protein